MTRPSPQALTPTAAAALRQIQDRLARGMQEHLAAIVAMSEIANQVSNQAPEFKPSAAQLRMFRAMRDGRRMSRKQLESLPGVGRRAYGGPGSLDSLMELGLVDVKGGKFFLTEPGEAMAAEWLESTDGESAR